MHHSTFTLTDPDGIVIHVNHWAPDTPPRAVVQISHGMQEHGGRYARLANALVARGYAVLAHDHRGHGKTAGDPARLGKLGPGGWQGVLQDLKLLTDHIQALYPERSVFLLGHSWGSFLAQAYVQRWGSHLAGVIYSGTSGSDPLVRVGAPMTRQVARLRGADRQAHTLEKLAMGSFNKRFGSDPAGKDWLSRDPNAVSSYEDDPLCGTPFPNSFFVELVALMKAAWDPRNERRIPIGLPVYILGGTEDPVSHRTNAILPMVRRYLRYGLQDVSVRFYPGGRHEMFNEINREQVIRDLLAWMDARV